MNTAATACAVSSHVHGADLILANLVRFCALPVPTSVTVDAATVTFDLDGIDALTIWADWLDQPIHGPVTIYRHGGNIGPFDLFTVTTSVYEVPLILRALTASSLPQRRPQEVTR